MHRHQARASKRRGRAAPSSWRRRALAATEPAWVWAAWTARVKSCAVDDRVLVPSRPCECRAGSGARHPPGCTWPLPVAVAFVSEDRMSLGSASADGHPTARWTCALPMRRPARRVGLEYNDNARNGDVRTARTAALTLQERLPAARKGRTANARKSTAAISCSSPSPAVYDRQPRAHASRDAGDAAQDPIQSEVRERPP